MSGIVSIADEQSGGAMNKLLSVVMILGIALMATGETETIPVRLQYKYHAKESQWARFGAMDSRAFNLRVARAALPLAFKIMQNAEDNIILEMTGDPQEYFGIAAQKALADCGVALSASGPFRLTLFPKKLSLASYDGVTDGQKICSIALIAELTGPKGVALVRAEVENSGIAEFDDDDNGNYEELVDMTMHGLLYKLWASRVLFTDTALGSGRILKKDLGTYGFVSRALFALADSLAVSGTLDSTNVWLPSLAQMNRSAIRENVPLSSDQLQAVLPMNGNYSESDSIVALNGKKITIGILPMENATGRSDLNGVVADIQQALLNMYSQSKTVKVLEREKLSEILKEQALGLTGIMNDSTVIKVGNLSGLKAMVAGRVTTAGSYYRLTARIINMETSAVVVTASANAADANTISDAVPALAASLLAAFTGEKLAVNRNTMSYPSIAPMAIPAVTASIEDAWAGELNPACLSKVKQRDVSFFFSLATKFSGDIGVNHAETFQPPFENLGVNMAIPIGAYFASGFGIRHCYPYPRLQAPSHGYDIKEEETIFTVPFSVGINPAFSIGANARLHLLEYQITNPGYPFLEGNALFVDAKIGALFKVSQRFKVGLTYRPKSFYMDAQEKQSTQTSFVSVNRETPHDFRIGIAMYPLKWFFFFGDLQYEKFPSFPQMQPGFHLGWQLTYQGQLLGLKFMPLYSMIPLYIGYSHEPFNRITNTQAKYFSIGTGYYLNNIYVQWAMRFNVETGADRRIVIGSPNDNSVVADYSLTTPLFLCIGYRF
jgi:hypothetical protein